MAQYAFGDASQILYEAIWNEYCDWGVELAKIRLGDESLAPAEREATWWTLVEVARHVPAPAAPDHAVHHRGDLGAAAARRRRPGAADRGRLADRPRPRPPTRPPRPRSRRCSIWSGRSETPAPRPASSPRPGCRWTSYVPERLGRHVRAAPPGDRTALPGPAAAPRARPRSDSAGSGGRSVGHRRRDRGRGPARGQGRRPGGARPRPPGARAGRGRRGCWRAARARLANEAFVSKAPPSVVEGARARAAELEELVATAAGEAELGAGRAARADRDDSIGGTRARRTGRTIRTRC